MSSAKSAQSWGAKKVVGVDIDETLVRAAWKRRRTVWSQSYPQDKTSPSSEKDLAGSRTSAGKKRKSESDSDNEETNEPSGSRSLLAEYFPVSCEHMFGPLPIPPSKPHTACQFPHNAVFQTADWVTTEIADDAQGYDVIVAYAILSSCFTSSKADNN